jgi:hypothetical protein
MNFTHMEVLKKKEFWINSLILFLTLALCDWLFGKGWSFIKGAVTFQESLKDFTVRTVWVGIAIAVSFYGVSKK